MDHLTTLEERIGHYFPELLVDDYDWIRDPFTKVPFSAGQFTLREEEELTDITEYTYAFLFSFSKTWLFCLDILEFDILASVISLRILVYSEMID